MSRIHEILDDLRHRRSERRGEIQFFPPGTMAEIAEAVSMFADRAPQAFIDFYTMTNGLEIGYFRIAPLIETVWVDPPMLAVQHWGNGDSDCLRLEDAPDPDDPPVWFAGHDPHWVFQVCDRFSDWLERVSAEHWEHGEIYTPWACHLTGERRLYWYSGAGADGGVA